MNITRKLTIYTQNQTSRVKSHHIFNIFPWVLFPHTFNIGRFGTVQRKLLTSKRKCIHLLPLGGILDIHLWQFLSKKKLVSETQAKFSMSVTDWSINSDFLKKISLIRSTKDPYVVFESWRHKNNQTNQISYVTGFSFVWWSTYSSSVRLLNCKVCKTIHKSMTKIGKHQI